MKRYEEIKYPRNKKRKKISPHDSFNYVDYTFEFDFCDIREKSILYRCLKDAWEWAHPPVKSVESADDSKESEPNK